jgi:4-hydroxy-3-polyprenylbenzoate decarboxylase
VAEEGGRLPWLVGISGASGTPYATAVIGALLDAGEPVDLIVSKAARLTILDETGLPFRDARWRADLAALLGWPADDDRLEAVRHWRPTDFGAGPSSGSYPARGMLVVPASAAAVAGIAAGLSKDLLQRAASVTLKERRPLLVVVREMPFTGALLRQLAELDAAGAVVLPASPAFYAGARDVRQLVDFVAGKILDLIDVPHALYRRWTGELGAARTDADGHGDADSDGA